MSEIFKIQDWAMPVITRKDQEAFDQGYRRSMAKRGFSTAGFSGIIRGAAKAGKAAKARRESI